MKKLLVSLALLGTFAAMSAKGANDSYMYWMVEDAKYQVGGPVLFDAVELYAINTKTGARSERLGAAEVANPGSTGLGSTSERAVIYNVSAYASSDWSFIVEAYIGDSITPLSTSTGISYEAAFAMGAIYEHLAPSGAGIVTFSTFAIPEPTSGLLMLFGLCGLALKRKRA